MEIRLHILFIVFKWAFKGWKFDIDVEAYEETEDIESVTLKATYPEESK